MEPMDLRAFYCAGEAMRQHANPYRVEPNRSCQRRVLAAAGLRLDERFVLPAPLPPYALVAFAGLSRLTFGSATELWLLINLAALTVSIVYASRLSGVTPILAGASLVVSAGYVSIVLGQVIPIVLAAALLAALCARRGNGIGAAAAATVMALEPHLALPVWLGLALLPNARKPLAAAAALLTVVTLACGTSLNLEYVLSVLPQHARSELLNLRGQYGLSPLLVAIGIPFRDALVAGSISYASMVACGLFAGAALRRRLRDAAFLVTTPLACAVLGGPFLHVTQTVVAIPLGLMLVAIAPRRSLRLAVVLAIAMLAVPWQLIGKPDHIGATAFARAGISVRPYVARSDESIEVPFTASLDAVGRQDRANSAFVLLEFARKLPTWVALIVIASGAFRIAAQGRRDERSVSFAGGAT